MRGPPFLFLLVAARDAPAGSSSRFWYMSRLFGLFVGMVDDEEIVHVRSKSRERVTARAAKCGQARLCPKLCPSFQVINISSCIIND